MPHTTTPTTGLPSRHAVDDGIPAHPLRDLAVDVDLPTRVEVTLLPRTRGQDLPYDVALALVGTRMPGFGSRRRARTPR